MKSIIIYYSQTGNTKKIAESIYSGASSTCDVVDLVSIMDVDQKALRNYDLIGIGMPVWCEREPVNIRRFMDQMTDMQGKYVFLFCTHATLAGRFMKRVVQMLEEKGMIVIGWEDWFGGNVNPISEKPYYTDGHPDKLDLQEAEVFGREIMNRYTRITDGEISLIQSLPQGSDYVARYGELVYPSPIDTAQKQSTSEIKEPRIILTKMSVILRNVLCVSNIVLQIASIWQEKFRLRKHCANIVIFVNISVLRELSSLRKGCILIKIILSQRELSKI